MEKIENKKAVIYVFSGTGNTMKAVKLYAEKFNSCGVDTEICKIDKNYKTLSSPDDFDYIGLAYPIYGFNAPKLVVDFVETLPDGVRRKVFVVKTSGEPVAANDASSMLISRILRKKGYIISNEYHYVMPYNMIFRHDDYTAVKMYKTMRDLCPIDAEEVLKGEWRTLSPTFFGKIASLVCRVEYPWFKHNGKRFKADESKCISCGKCVRGCPMGNIKSEDGKISFGGNCIMCAGCSFGCPENAISIGLLNGWKVNGAYPTDGNFAQSQKNKKYCKKAYDRYFAEAEQKIKKHNK